MIDFGLKRGDKIVNQLGVPAWVKENEKYSKRCLRGLVDTDGSIIFSKRDKQISINFTNHNYQLMQDFKEIALKLNYHFAKANWRNTRLYRKEEVARFINDIKPFKTRGRSIAW